MASPEPLDEFPVLKYAQDLDQWQQYQLLVQLGLYEAARKFLLTQLASGTVISPDAPTSETQITPGAEEKAHADHEAERDVEVAVELAILDFRQGRWGECSRRSSALLKDPSTPAQEHQLLTLLRDMANIYYAGSLGAALQSARDAAPSIARVAFSTSYKRATFLVELYLRILKQVTSFSNWSVEDDRGGQWNPSGHRHWLDFIGYAEHLRETRRFYHSWLILKLLSTRDDEREAVIRSIEKLSAACQADPGFEARSCRATCEIALSQMRGLQGDWQSRKALLRSTTETYASLPQEAKTDTSDFFDFEKLSLNLSEHESEAELARSTYRLGEKAIKAGNLSRGDQYLSDACEIALQEELEEFSVWRKVHEDLLSKTTENNRDLSNGRTRQWRFRTGIEVSSQLEWFDRFEAKMNSIAEGAKFDDPMALMLQQQAKRTICRRWNDQEGLKECEDRIKEIQRSLPEARDPSYFRDFGLAQNLNFRDGTVHVLIKSVRKLCAGQHISNEDAQALLGDTPIVGDVLPREIALVTEFHFSPPKLPHWPATFAKIESLLVDSFSADVDKKAGQHLLFCLQQVRVSRSQSLGECVNEQGRLVSLLNRCYLEIRRDHAMSLFDAHLFTAQVLTRSSPHLHDKDKALEECDQARMVSMEFPAVKRDSHKMALLYTQYAETLHVKILLGAQVELSVVKGYIQQADRKFDEMRADLAERKTRASIELQTRFSKETRGVAELQKVGIATHYAALQRDPTNKSVLVDLWTWIQRSKSRTIVDRMALTAQIPAALLDQAKLDKVMGAPLVDEFVGVESELETLAKVEDPTSRYYARKQREEILDKMKTVPSTQRIEKVLRGRPLRVEDVAELATALRGTAKNASGRLVLVDWFTVSMLPAFPPQWSLLALIIDPNDNFEIVHRELKLPSSPAMPNAVDAWVQKYLVEPAKQATDRSAEAVIAALNTQGAQADLQALQPLVAPLAEIVEANDTVVLCPTQKLHRVPVHAIKLPAVGEDTEKCILETNDFMYCHSLSTLAQCAEARRNPTNSSNGDALGLFPLQVGYLDDEMRRDFRDLAGGDLVEDEAVTLTNVLNMARVLKPRHMLFYGHAKDESDAPLNSHLVLFEEPGPGSTDDGAEGDRLEYKMQASDVLRHMVLEPGAHIDLIACATGLSANTGDDEFLGLVPAFLCSGAGSVLSTLWPIRQTKGVDFVRTLLLAIDEERADSREAGTMANLVRCMRHAALELKGEPGTTFADWASFVFHGFWKSPVPPI